MGDIWLIVSTFPKFLFSALAYWNPFPTGALDDFENTTAPKSSGASSSGQSNAAKVCLLLLLKEL